MLLAASMLACGASRGRVLTDADIRSGAVVEPGDEVVLRDFSRLEPQSALSEKSEPGKWWLRPYRHTQGGDSGVMLMTIERDMEQPERCLAPPVTFPLQVEGWYQVWVATYRGPYGGGIDARLSGDDCFVHLDPQQVPLHKDAPPARVGAIVELLHTPAADLTGQSLVLRQPFGSYESFHWGFCAAALAYVRLIRLSDEQVAAFKRDQADDTRRVIGFDDDNFSRFWRWGGENERAVVRILEAFRYHDIAFFGMCLGTATATHIPTPYSDFYVNHGARLGDKRVNRSYRAFVDQGIDLLKLHVERAHKYGLKLLPTLRMSSCGHQGTVWKKLPKLEANRGRLNYATTEVKEHFVTFVRYILETYDADGFILDFTRHCMHFEPDEPDKVGHMNTFCAAMREMVDGVSVAKEKKLLLCASFAESDYVSSFHRVHLKTQVKPEERLAVQGIDVAAWLERGFFDIIMPEGPNIEKHISACRGTTTKCFPRWTATRDRYSKPLGAGIHDPKASEDKKDRPLNWHVGPLDYETGWLDLHSKGADGLYVFNNPRGWVSLRRMGHPDEVAERVAAARVYGLVEGPVIAFVE